MLRFLLLVAACTSTSPDDSAEPKIDSSTDSGADTDSGQDTGTPYTGAAAGPWTVSTTTVQVDGDPVTVYVPNSPAASTSLAVVSHGFARGPSNHITTATRLSSWGFVVATPALPSYTDHEANGKYIAQTLVPAMHTAYDASSDGQVVLVGHSAGGLASLVAAALVTNAGYVGLDAVDMSDVGNSYASSVTSPALLLAGDPSRCNSDGNSAGWADMAGGEHWLVSVSDATHCDFESETDSLCTALCGDEDDARQDLIQTYAVAWALQHTRGTAADYIAGGSQAEADRSAGRLTW
jgi:pimeloyl-ACP methyl ester carboxylesterase